MTNSHRPSVSLAKGLRGATRIFPNNPLVAFPRRAIPPFALHSAPFSPAKQSLYIARGRPKDRYLSACCMKFWRHRPVTLICDSFVVCDESLWWTTLVYAPSIFLSFVITRRELLRVPIPTTASTIYAKTLSSRRCSVAVLFLTISLKIKIATRECL